MIRARDVSAPAPPTEAQRRAAKHLLRHLDDPRALVRNALVASLLGDDTPGRVATSDALTVVANVVRQCAEHIRTSATNDSGMRESQERQYHILLRCDLGRESHETVARDLALSRRQFYRERALTCVALARFITERVRKTARAPRAVTIDRLQFELSRARVLRQCGDAGASERALRDLIDSNDEIGSRIEAWCSLVDVLLNANRVEDALAELDLARAAADLAGPRRPGALEARARLEMQWASMLWFMGRMHETRAIDQRIEPLLAQLAASGAHHKLEFVAATRVRQALCALMNGELERASATIDRVAGLLDALDEPSVALRATYLITRGMYKDHVPGGSGEALSTLTGALVLAERHGLVELVVDAMAALSSNAQVRGDPAQSLRHVYDVLPLAERVGLPVQHGMLLNIAAISETQAGRHDAALQLLARARKTIAPQSLEHVYTNLAEAQARLAIRDFAGASGAAEQAYAAADATGNRRLAGTALRQLAESFDGLGRRVDAGERILGSVEVLERDGPPVALYQAYRASARIRGDRRHQRNATELAAILKQ
ncbi:MAG: hypothetical protein ABI346_01340 [Candidatus Baltobacteraceae bacterium]